MIIQAVALLVALPLILAAPLTADDEIAAPLVITGGTLFDGTGREPPPDSVIVIRDGKIVMVTTRGAEAALVHARRLDAQTSCFVTAGWCGRDRMSRGYHS
jgi:hypothetical protein